MKIPCAENRCLKYPVCKVKEYIKCDLLHQYVNGGRAYINQLDSDGQAKWWIKNVAPLLPNLIRVCDEQTDYPLITRMVNPK